MYLKLSNAAFPTSYSLTLKLRKIILSFPATVAANYKHSRNVSARLTRSIMRLKRLLAYYAAVRKQRKLPNARYAVVQMQDCSRQYWIRRINLSISHVVFSATTLR